MLSRSSAYRDLLGAEDESTKVNVRVSTQISAPNDIVKFQASHPCTIGIAAPENFQPTIPSLAHSVEPHSTPAAQAKSPPDPTTRQSERFSVRCMDNSLEPPTLQKKGPQRKTLRRWIEKAMHIPQEDIEREEDAMQYAAGLARVYIDPPGSVRAVLSDSSHPPDERKTARTRPLKVKQKIAVFKSLCLTDPLWLVKKKGSWEGAHDQRIVEPEASQSLKRNHLPPGFVLGESGSQARQLVDTIITQQIFSTSNSPSREPGAQNGQSHDQIIANTTSSALESSSKKRKAQSIATNGVQRPQKRGRPRKSTLATSTPQLAEAVTPMAAANAASQNVVQSAEQAVVRQPISGQAEPGIRHNLLFRLMQNQHKTYNSPYSSKQTFMPGYADRAPHNLIPSLSQPFPHLMSESLDLPQGNGSDTIHDPAVAASSDEPLPQLLTPDIPVTSSRRLDDINHGLMNVQHVPRPRLDSSQMGHAPFATGAQKAFGFQITIPHTNQILANELAPSSPLDNPDRNKHPELPQHGTGFQKSLQSPPFDCCSRYPTNQSDSNATVPAQDAPVSKNKRNSPMERPWAHSEAGKLTHTDASQLPAWTDHEVLYKPKLLATLEALESTLSRSSAHAEAIQYADVTARLLVSYDNVVGNLLLSADRTKISFWSLDQEFGEEPHLLFRTTEVSENPLVSMKGSRPMELRVKRRDGGENVLMCHFYIGQSDEAYRAANVMRASIVSARIICSASKGETNTYKLFKENTIPNIEVVKPFKCDTCGKRFKNREGIKYHLEKSNTTCNPNFMPLAESAKPKRPSKPKMNRLAKPGVSKLRRRGTRTMNSVEIEKSKDEEGATLISVEEADSSCIHDSDDSVFEWATSVAFANPGQTVKSLVVTPRTSAATDSRAKTQAKAQHLISEEELLQELAHEASNETSPDDLLNDTVENVVRELVEEVVEFSALHQQCIKIPGVNGESRSDDSKHALDQVKCQRSKDTILDVVSSNFGIFPGGKSLWFALVALWLQNHARLDSLPTSKLCDKALHQLLQEQKLISTTFSVEESHPSTLKRTILMIPTAKLDSPAVKILEELINVAYPDHYVPSRFAPRPEVRSRLEDFLSRSSGSLSRKGQEHLTSEADSRADYAYDSEYKYGLEDETSAQSDNVEDSEASDSDSSYYVDKPKKSKRAENQARRMKTYWATSKALSKSSATFPFSQTPEADTNPDGSRFERPKGRWRGQSGGPIVPEEKKLRKMAMVKKVQHFSLTCLQDPKTGAWNQTLHREPSPDRPRTRLLKWRFPEVLTYLQSKEGAWMERAYGHGSNPIHSRPARRADGNPSFETYRKKIEESHRPILMPNPRNRQFLPAVPSKVLLGTAKVKQAEKDYAKQSSAQKATNRQANPKKREISVLSIADDGDGRLNRKTQKWKSSLASNEAGEFAQPTMRNEKVNNPQITPKRRRTVTLKIRRQSSTSEQDSDTEFHSVAESVQFPPRLTRKAAKDGMTLDAIQLLGYFQPRLFSDFSKFPNPGLIMLPTSFWAFDSSDVVRPSLVHNTTPGLVGIEKVADWEQGLAQDLLARRSKAAGYLWVNHTVDALNSSFGSETIKLKWESSTAFKIEDLPYEDLHDSEDIDSLRKAAHSKSLIPLWKKQSRSEQKKLRTRRLTAWPTDFDGVLDSIDTVRKDLDVELAPRLNPEHGRALDGMMTKQEEIRLLVAIIAISTITGGIKETPDWVLVANIFPKFSANYIDKVWRRMWKSSKTLIQAMTTDFQSAFLSSYEAGTLPEIDYANLVEYDWPRVIDWAIENIHVTRTSENEISLPNTCEGIKKWNVKEQEFGADKVREMFFDPKIATYKRMERTSAIARTYPSEAALGLNIAEDIKVHESTLARGLIKALVLTPEYDYDKNVARAKLLRVGEDVVEEVTQVLLAEKVIMPVNKGRVVPGRAYQPTDAFFSPLRKHGSELLFTDAMAFKIFLDAEFASGKRYVRHEYLANEGAIMCITNLQAHGRIKLKSFNVPMNTMGLTGGGYETRKMPKETFRFAMDIHPTISYLYNKDIPPLQILAFLEPPTAGAPGEGPIWYGVTNKLIRSVWKQVLVALSTIVSVRSGASVASLEQSLRPALEEWEIRRFMEWGVNVGLVERPDPFIEGWKMGEWWWVVVGEYCIMHDTV